MSEALLELKNLDVTYSTGTGDVAAVRNVNLRLEAGDTLGVAGESGSGKSTVAMSVLRLLPRSARVSGAVLLDGEDVTTMKWGRLRAVRWAEASVVFQGAMHALNPVRKIGEQIAEPIRIHAPAGKALSEPQVRARVAELLEQVVSAASGFSARQLVKAPKQPQVLAAGEILVDRGVLAGQAERLTNRDCFVDDVATHDLRPAGIRRQQRRQDADERRLAGAVRTEQPEDRALGHLEVDTRERKRRAEALSDTFDGDGRCRQAATLSRLGQG